MDLQQWLESKIAAQAAEITRLEGHIQQQEHIINAQAKALGDLRNQVSDAKEEAQNTYQPRLFRTPQWIGNMLGVCSTVEKRPQSNISFHATPCGIAELDIQVLLGGTPADRFLADYPIRCANRLDWALLGFG